MKLRFLNLRPISIAGATVLAGAITPAVKAQVLIANPPPKFAIYDVDRREQWMEREIGREAGQPALSHQEADAALGMLNGIRRNERVRRSSHGGRLTAPDLQAINARLDRLATTVGLR